MTIAVVTGVLLTIPVIMIPVLYLWIADINWMVDKWRIKQHARRQV